MSVCDLCGLLVSARCDARAVAAALAYFPPEPPSYTISAYTIAPGVGVADDDAAPDTAGLARAAVAGRRPSTHSLADALAQPRAVDRARQTPFACAFGAAARTHTLTVSPRARPDARAALGFPAMCVWRVPTRRKRVIPVLAVAYPGAALTVLFSHGNAVDLGLTAPAAVDMCVNMRVNVVVYDYTGYGPTVGVVAPSQEDTFADIEAVFDFLTTRSPLASSGESVCVYGQSLGSGPAVHLATVRAVRGLVLHSPLASGLRVLTDNRCLAPCDIYDNLSRLGRLRVTAGVFILHGTRDAEVDVTHAERLFRALPSRYQRATAPWFPDAGHNDIVELHRTEYYRRLRAFVTRCVPGSIVYADEPVVPFSRACAFGAQAWQAYTADEPYPEPPGARVVTASALTAPSAAALQPAVRVAEVGAARPLPPAATGGQLEDVEALPVPAAAPAVPPASADTDAAVLARHATPAPRSGASAGAPTPVTPPAEARDAPLRTTSESSGRSGTRSFGSQITSAVAAAVDSAVDLLYGDRPDTPSDEVDKVPAIKRKPTAPAAALSRSNVLSSQVRTGPDECAAAHASAEYVHVTRRPVGPNPRQRTPSSRSGRTHVPSPGTLSRESSALEDSAQPPADLT